MKTSTHTQKIRPEDNKERKLKTKYVYQLEPYIDSVSVSSSIVHDYIKKKICIAEPESEDSRPRSKNWKFKIGNSILNHWTCPHLSMKSRRCPCKALILIQQLAFLFTFFFCYFITRRIFIPSTLLYFNK